jgi:hypothetical protein
MLQAPVLRRSKSALDFSDRTAPLRSKMALLRLGMGKKKNRGADVDDKREKSREIDRLLRQEKRRRDKEIRVLLLGASLQTA